MPRSIQLFMAAELLCFGVTVFAWDVVVHKEFFTVIGVFLFMVTWSAISIAAGFSARQQPGFTLKTASRVRSYRITAFIYAAVGVTVLLLFFLLPLMQHR